MEFYEELLKICRNNCETTSNAANNTSEIIPNQNNFAAGKFVNVGTKTELLLSIAECHMRLCNYSDALRFFNRALDIFQNTAHNSDKDRNIAKTINDIGICHIELCNYSDALTFFNRALDIKQDTAFNSDKDHSITNTINNIGCCHIGLNNHSDALTFLNRALDIFL